MHSLSPELENRVREDVRNALLEDIGSGDLTAELVPAAARAHARVVVREEAVICGSPWFDAVFAQLDSEITVTWHVAEGDIAHAGDVVCELDGPARPLLTGERTALNFLQTLSGTATAARAFSAAVANTGATVLDTRKTLPGLRLAQKYAVRTGGAENHRVGLYDGILVKENHIAACGGIGPAVAAALRSEPAVLVEVEVESADEAVEAMRAGAHRLLLDNFAPDDLRHVVNLRNESFEGVSLEASGGITLGNADEIAATGVDYLSVGGMTKDVRAVDFSMRFELR